MTDKQESLEAIHDIRRIMERSSKFISLSGLSGVVAGICALVGAYIASKRINCFDSGDCNLRRLWNVGDNWLISDLYLIAAITFICAFVSSFFFTWLRSRKTNTPLWGAVAYRVFWNLLIPLVAGGLFLLRMIEIEQYEMIAPGCLIFYGIALINVSKYTFGEIRYLGYGQLILGVINLWMIGYGLYFWAAGFGLLHIIYGIIMWMKYERNDIKSNIN